MSHKISRIRVKRSGEKLTIDALGQSARGTPIFVKSVEGKAPRKDKKKRDAEMSRLLAELLGSE